MLRTSNPALSSKSFGGFVGVRSNDDTMTIQGTVNKTGILLALVIAGAVWPWRLFFDSGNPEAVMGWMLVGGIGGFVAALATIFKRTWAPITAPVYAVCEGLFLGAISATFEARYHGIVFQAMALTFGTLLALLAAYKSRLDQGDRELQAGGRRRDGRDRVGLYDVVRSADVRRGVGSCTRPAGWELASAWWSSWSRP